MIYNNSNSIKSLLLASNALKLMCDEFTSAEYNKMRAKGSASIARLVNEKVLTISKVETFEKEVPVSYWRQGRKDTVLVNDNGTPIDGISAYYYQCQPVAVKMALDLAFNNGRPLQTIEKEVGATEVVMCKRYFYTVNRNALSTLMEKEKKQLKKVVERKKKLAAEATKKYDAVFALYKAL